MESENVYSNQDQLENIIVENWPLKGFSQKEIDEAQNGDDLQFDV